MPRVLIIAYGNPLRSDDGVAWHAAELLQARFSPSVVEVLRQHQLGPELAEAVSRSQAVIFVDAAANFDRPGESTGEIKIQELQPGRPQPVQRSAFGHAVSPSVILDLAAQFYGARARAFSATVAGQNFDHGQSLSPPVAAALPALVSRIEFLVRDLLSAR